MLEYWCLDLNENQLKKVRVIFPNIAQCKMAVESAEKPVIQFPQAQNINNRIYSEIFTGTKPDLGYKKMPRVQGFNATFMNTSHILGSMVDVQFTFGSSEEKKVMTIIETHGGKIIDSKLDSNQNGIVETNGSGKETRDELVAEILRARDFN